MKSKLMADTSKAKLLYISAKGNRKLALSQIMDNTFNEETLEKVTARDMQEVFGLQHHIDFKSQLEGEAFIRINKNMITGQYIIIKNRLYTTFNIVDENTILSELVDSHKDNINVIKRLCSTYDKQLKNSYEIVNRYNIMTWHNATAFMTSQPLRDRIANYENKTGEIIDYFLKDKDAEIPF